MTSIDVQHQTGFRVVVERVIHPFVLMLAMSLWVVMGDTGVAFVTILFIVQGLLRICEWRMPARPAWKQSPAEIATLGGITMADYAIGALALTMYEGVLTTVLPSISTPYADTPWPSDWPLVVQILAVFFAGEFIFYWIHRSIHTSPVFWRISGHGFHHSFKNLHAINFLAAHPFEMFFLTVPTVIVAYILGAPAEAVGGAAILGLANASIAHANVRTRSNWLSFLFTTSNHHVRHHSAVFEESNTNYSCNAIIWDRLFGTFSQGDVVQSGIGPTEPSTLDKLLLPLREPDDIKTAPR